MMLAGRRFDELLREHADALAVLRSAVEDSKRIELERSDLNLLRYLLSSGGDVKKALESIEKDDDYRRSNAEWLGAKTPPQHQLVKDYFVADVIGEAKDGDILFVLRSGVTACNLKQLPNGEEISSYYPAWVTFVKEMIYRKCAEETLRTNWLTKVIIINDMSSMPFFLNIKFLAGFGESSQLSEFLHPQLLEKQVMVNVPVFYGTLFNLCRPFLSEKTQEKITIWEGNTDSVSCPFSPDKVDPSVLPVFLGGTSKQEIKCLTFGVSPEDKSVLDVKSPVSEEASENLRVRTINP